MSLYLKGLVDPLLFHTNLFCLTGANSERLGTLVALPGDPAFMPIAEARRPQPGYTSGSAEMTGERIAPAVRGRPARRSRYGRA